MTTENSGENSGVPSRGFDASSVKGRGWKVRVRIAENA
jgi:hypothetical protein